MKSKQAQMNVGMIVILIMGIIIALALLPQIFNTQNQMTDKQNMVNEVVSVAAAKTGTLDNFDNTKEVGPVLNVPTGWKATECPLSSIVITNASGTALEDTTDYTFNVTSGGFILENTTTTVDAFKKNNNSYVDYTFCADGYNTNSGSRGVAGLIGLMAVFALLAFVIGYGVKEWLDK